MVIVDQKIDSIILNLVNTLNYIQTKKYGQNLIIDAEEHNQNINLNDIKVNNKNKNLKK